jgi:cysteine desulfurase/selenocysteine lyase
MPSPAVVPRVGERALFSQLRAAAYLNHAAIAPLSDAVRAAAQRVLEDLTLQGSPSFPLRLAERQRLREDLARLLHAHSDEIALVPSTMYGLAAVAMSLPWRPRARVIALAGEYPTNVSVWQRACETFGLTLTLLPVADFAHPDGPDFSALERELARGDVQLCAVSAVQFQSGLRMPLARIAALCHAHGAQLAVDAVQALGSLPFDVQALDVDYAAAGSHKWLLGVDGCGVLYVRRELLAQLRPAFAGAFSHVDAERIFMQGGQLRYDRALRAEARVFEGGMLSSVGCAALAASVPMLLALGPEHIHEHVNRYLDLLETGLLAREFRSLRLPDSERRSCILGVVPPPGAAEASVLATSLAAHGVVCSGPDGVLRFAPHFANALSEVDVVLTAIDATL